MKILLIVIVIVAAIALFAFKAVQSSYQLNIKTNSIHAFKIAGLNGDTIDFANFKGKKILVVNTASACGFTKQYAALQKIYESYGDKLVIVGFPCNQFAFQESGSAEEIQQFCQKNFGVTFPLTEKVKVKGKKACDIYKWLCHKINNGVLDAKVSWNFNKFLLDEEGKLLAYFNSKTTPDSEEILRYLK